MYKLTARLDTCSRIACEALTCVTINICILVLLQFAYTCWVSLALGLGPFAPPPWAQRAQAFPAHTFAKKQNSCYNKLFAFAERGAAACSIWPFVLWSPPWAHLGPWGSLAPVWALALGELGRPLSFSSYTCDFPLGMRSLNNQSFYHVHLLLKVASVGLRRSHNSLLYVARPKYPNQNKHVHTNLGKHWKGNSYHKLLLNQRIQYDYSTH